MRRRSSTDPPNGRHGGRNGGRSFRIVFALWVALTSIAIVAVPISAQTPESPAAISLRPDCAPTASDGYAITVSGQDFNPFTSVIVTFDAGRGGRPESFRARTDGYGQFVVDITPTRRPAGTYVVRADDLKQREAETPFSVPCGGRFAPRIVFDPPIGPPGFVTRLRGVGFPPGFAATLSWTETLFGSAYPASVQVGSTGDFQLNVLIFRHDFLGPRHVTVAAAPGGPSYPPATAEFLVVPGRQQPRDFRVRR